MWKVRAEIHLRPQVKYSSQCAIYHEKQACLTIFFRKKSYTKFHENPMRGLVAGST